MTAPSDLTCCLFVSLFFFCFFFKIHIYATETLIFFSDEFEKFGKNKMSPSRLLPVANL